MKNEADFFKSPIQPKRYATAPSIAPCGNPMKTIADIAMTLRTPRSFIITVRSIFKPHIFIAHFTNPLAKISFGIENITFNLNFQSTSPLKKRAN